MGTPNAAVPAAGHEIRWDTRHAAIPSHLVPMMKAHMETHVRPQADTLLFPAKHWPPSTHGSIRPAPLPSAQIGVRPPAALPGRPGGATGATLADLMARVGSLNPTGDMRYQHCCRGTRQGDAALDRCCAV